MSMQFSFCLKQGQGLRASAAHVYPMFHLSATPPSCRGGGELYLVGLYQWEFGCFC